MSEVSNMNHASAPCGERADKLKSSGSDGEAYPSIMRLIEQTELSSSGNEDDISLLPEKIVDKSKSSKEEVKEEEAEGRGEGDGRRRVLFCETEIRTHKSSDDDKVDSVHSKRISIHSSRKMLSSDTKTVECKSQTESIKGLVQGKKSVSLNTRSTKNNNHLVTELQLSSQVISNHPPKSSNPEGSSSEQRAIPKQFDTLKERYVLATTVIDQLRSQNQRLIQVNQRNRLLLQNTLVHQQNIRNKMVSHLSEAKKQAPDPTGREDSVANPELKSKEIKTEVKPEVAEDAFSFKIPKDQIVDIKINKKTNEGVEQFKSGLADILDLVHTQHLNVMQHEKERYIEVANLNNAHSEQVNTQFHTLEDVAGEEIPTENFANQHDSVENNNSYIDQTGSSLYEAKDTSSANIDFQDESHVFTASCSVANTIPVPREPETATDVSKTKKKGLWKSCFPTFKKKHHLCDKGKYPADTGISSTERVNKNNHPCNNVECIRLKRIVMGQNPTNSSLKNCYHSIQSELVRGIEIIYDDRQMAKVRVFSLQIDTDINKHFSKLFCQVEQVVYERNTYKNDLRNQLHYNQDLMAASETLKRKFLRVTKQYHFYKSKASKFQKVIYKLEAERSHKQTLVSSLEMDYEQGAGNDSFSDSAYRGGRQRRELAEKEENQRYFNQRRSREERRCVGCKDELAEKEILAASFIRDHKELKIKYEHSEKRVKKLELDLSAVNRELDVTKYQLQNKSEELKNQSCCKNCKETYKLVNIDFVKAKTENEELKKSKLTLEEKVGKLITKFEKTKEQNKHLQETLRAYRGKSERDGKVEYKNSEPSRHYKKKEHVSLLLESDTSNTSVKGLRQSGEKLEEKCEKLEEEKKALENIIIQLTERVQYMLRAGEGKRLGGESTGKIKGVSKFKLERDAIDSKGVTDALNCLDAFTINTAYNTNNEGDYNTDSSSETQLPPHSVPVEQSSKFVSFVDVSSNASSDLTSECSNEETLQCNKCLKLESKIVRRNKKIKEQSNIITNLENRVDEIQNELDQCLQREKQVSRDFQTTKHELTNEICSLKEKLKEDVISNKNVSQLTSENERLQNELLELKETLQAESLKVKSLQVESEENEVLKDALAKTEEALSKSSKEVVGLKGENRNLKEQIDNLEERSRVSADQLNAIKELEDHNQKLKAERDTLKENVLEESARCEEMSIELQKVREENNNLQKDIEDLCQSNEVAELQKDVKHLESICQELRTENQELIVELQDNGKEKKDLEKRIASLEESLEEVKEEEKSSEDKEEEIFKLNKQIEELQNDVLEKAEEMKSLERNFVNEREEVGKLKETLKDMQLKKKREDLSVISTKSIPKKTLTKNADLDVGYSHKQTLSTKKETIAEEVDRGGVVDKDSQLKEDVKEADDDDDFDSDFLNESYVPTWLQPTKKAEKNVVEDDQGVNNKGDAKKAFSSWVNAADTPRPQSQPQGKSSFGAKDREEVKSKTQVKARPAWTHEEEAVVQKKTETREKSKAAPNSSRDSNMIQKPSDSSDPFVTSLELTANTRRGKRPSLAINPENDKEAVRPKTAPEISKMKCGRAEADSKVMTRSLIDEETELQKAAALSRRQRGSISSLQMTSEASKEEVRPSKAAVNYSTDDFEDELDRFTKFEARRKQSSSSQVQPQRRSYQGDELKILSSFGDNSIHKRS